MIDLLLNVAISMFVLSIVFSLYRMIRGPTVPDRMLALDVISYGLAVVMGLIAIVSGSPYLIVISFSLALWFFIGALYVARYLEGEEIGE
ncbi:MAG: monovalent cation/H+ antiporter complex subunit F [Candidatus Verstraetearchaeota archaeon]|nr:monovalent cation/H+ antiporter complex subunit F [Candidatus Verstraetearchaeota archaeon]